MRRFILVALPSSAAFGPLIPAAGSMFAFRVLVLLLGVLALGCRGMTVDAIRSAAIFRSLIALWIVVGLVGSLFVESLDMAMRNLIPLFIGFILGYALITTKDPKRVLNNLQTGWVIAFVVTGALAIREMATGVHMSNYLPSHTLAELARVDPRFVASVFGNPNAYAAFLVTTFAFLGNGLLRSEKPMRRSCYVGMILALCVLMLATGSRLCLFALVLESLIFIGYAGRSYRNSVIAGAVILSMSLLLVGTGVADSLASQFPGKLASSTPSQLIQEVLSGDSTSSGGSRLDLYKDGLWMVGNSPLLGVGPGNFGVIIASGDAPFDAGGAVDPHNLYLEIASQYGLLVFLAFVWWIAVCLRVFLRAARCVKGEERSWGVIMVVAVTGNAVSALANSSYLSASINWVFIATLLLAAVMIERKGKELGPSLIGIDHNMAVTSSGDFAAAPHR